MISTACSIVEKNNALTLSHIKMELRRRLPNAPKMTISTLRSAFQCPTIGCRSGDCPLFAFPSNIVENTSEWKASIKRWFIEMDDDLRQTHQRMVDLVIY